MKLYEITEEIRELMDMEDDIDKDTFKDTLEGLNLVLEDKADNYAKVIQMVDADIYMLDKEIKRLSAMKKTKTNRINWLKQNLFDSMKRVKNTKFKTELFSFNIAKNPAKLIISEDAKLDKKYMVAQEPIVDKKLLKESIKLGEVIKGVELVQGESLRIK